MTAFEDGPAKGEKLMLQRAPVFLRVVQSQKLGGDFGKWDALDQLEDRVEEGETAFVYVLTAKPGNCHVNYGGGRGGWYKFATYRLFEQQADQAILCSNEKWRAWTERQAVPKLL